MMHNILHRFSRVDKVDVPEDWPEEAEQIEQSIEELKKVCSDIQKKISSGLYSTVTSDADKKLKKIPHFGLGNVLSESGQRMPEQNEMMKNVLQRAGQLHSDLAGKTLAFEFEVEASVVAPLRRIADEDCTGILKQRKQLGKACAELRNARERLRAAEQQEATKVQAGGTIDPTQSKVVQAQMQEMDAKRDVDQGRDLTLRDYFSFSSKDGAYAETLLHLLELEADHYRTCLKFVEEAIPEVQAVIVEQRQLQVFGRDLSDHLKETGREISYALEVCIGALKKEGALKEQGLFRIAGTKTKIDLLTSAINVRKVDDRLLGDCDSAVVADALKQYLRSLPEPLLTTALYDDWIQAANTISKGDLSEFERCLSRLPPSHHRNLRELIRFLSMVARYESSNKMNAQNLGIVFGPNLLKQRTASETSGSTLQDVMNDMMNTNPGNVVVETLIANADHFFPNVGGSPNLARDRAATEPSPALPSIKEHTRNGSYGGTTGDGAGLEVLSTNSGGRSSSRSNSPTALRRRVSKKPPAPPPPVPISHFSVSQAPILLATAEMHTDQSQTSTAIENGESELDLTDAVVTQELTPTNSKETVIPSKTRTVSQPPSKPETGSQPPSKPQASSQPPSKPETVNQSASHNKTVSQPPSKPETGSQPPSKPQGGSQPPSKPQASSQPPSKPEAVNQSASHNKTVSQPPSKPEAGSQPPSKPEAGSQPPSKPETANQSASHNKTVSQPPSKPETVSQSPSHSKPVSQPPSKQTVSQSPSKPETVSQPPSKPETVSQSPSKPETVSQPPSKPETVSQSPSKPETVSQSPSKPETVSQSPSHNKTLSQPPSKAETVSQPPSKPQTVSQSPSKPETVSQSASDSETVSQSSSKSERVSQSPSNSETVMQSPSDNEAVNQSVSKNEAVSQSPSHNTTDNQSPTPGETVNQSPNSETASQLPSNIEIVSQSPSHNETVSQSSPVEKSPRLSSTLPTRPTMKPPVPPSLSSSLKRDRVDAVPPPTPPSQRPHTVPPARPETLPTHHHSTSGSSSSLASTPDKKTPPMKPPRPPPVGSYKKSSS